MYKGFICFTRSDLHPTCTYGTDDIYVQTQNIQTIVKTPDGAIITLGNNHSIRVKLSIQDLMTRIARANS